MTEKEEIEMQLVRGISGFVVCGFLKLEAVGASNDTASHPQAAAREQTPADQPGQEAPRKKDGHWKPITHEKEEPPTPKAVEEGIIPKSIRIPWTDLSLKIGGYAKVDFIEDFSAIGNADQFKTNSIPAEGTDAAAKSGRTTIHARETRVNLDCRSGDQTLKGSRWATASISPIPPPS